MSNTPKPKRKSPPKRTIPYRRKDKETGRVIRRKRNEDGTKRSGPTGILGDDYLMPIVCARTLELYAVYGIPQREIGGMLVKEYPDLVRVPTHTTIQEWIKAAAGDVTNREQMRNDYLERTALTTAALMRKFMPIAVADQLDVKRTRMQDGERVSYIDDNAMKEQVEASKIVMRVIGIEGKLNGIGANEKGDEKEGVLSVHAVILQTINQNVTTGRQEAAIGNLLIESGDETYIDIEPS